MMLSYVCEVKRGFRDQYGFQPSGGTEQDPIFNNIPDGIYPMTVEGKPDWIVLKNGGLSFLNNEEEAKTKFGK